LSLIFIAPARFSNIILGKVIGNTILSLLTFIISFLTVRFLFQAPILIESPGYLLISLIAAVVCFITVSICIAYLLTLSRKTQLYMNCIEIPIILLCGFAFPVEELPEWIQPISYALPPTCAVKLIRMSVTSIESLPDYLLTLALLIGVTLLYTAISRLLYKMIERRVRINATLEMS
ncbi:MAG TPA: ABC transporter permease, partial [Lachnospiraceae bacterium]|nr:ABC transporter permease [Lachnospiraceae bacterium]